jgi:uncharacterized membrane protein
MLTQFTRLVIYCVSVLLTVITAVSFGVIVGVDTKSNTLGIFVALWVNLVGYGASKYLDSKINTWLTSGKK